MGGSKHHAHADLLVQVAQLLNDAQAGATVAQVVRGDDKSVHWDVPRSTHCSAAATNAVVRAARRMCQRRQRLGGEARPHSRSVRLTGAPRAATCGARGAVGVHAAGGRRAQGLGDRASARAADLSALLLAATPAAAAAIIARTGAARQDREPGRILCEHRAPRGERRWDRFLGAC